MKATAIDVARYFIAAADSDEGISNLKLLKMCAYAQGVCLAYLGHPLFDDEMEAWQHGPVVPTLYHKYKEWGRNPVPQEGMSVEYARMPFSDEEKLILEMVNGYYGLFSALALCQYSHCDFPGNFGSSLPIDKKAIREAFQSNALVRKLRESTVNDAAPDAGTVSGMEVWNALAD
jgi:uncharacterized phage-associated protein